MASKSYWQAMSVHGERSQAAILSWFAPVCDGMSVESADVLCDRQTDREKKARAVVVDGEGARHIATRTLGGRTFSISITRAPVATPKEP